MWIALFSWVLAFSTITIATASTASDSTIISRLNYGVVMKRVAVADIVSDTWNQAFVVRLPVIQSSVTGPSNFNCSNITNGRIRPLAYAYVRWCYIFTMPM